MQAGRLRDRVVILNITTSRTPSGHPEETLNEGATVWAEVKGISGRERISGGAETAQVWTPLCGTLAVCDRQNQKIFLPDTGAEMTCAEAAAL